MLIRWLIAKNDFTCRSPHYLPEAAYTFKGANPYNGDDCQVNILCMIPLTATEYAFRKENGSDTMFQLLMENQPNTIDAFVARHDRPCLMANRE